MIRGFCVVEEEEGILNVWLRVVSYMFISGRGRAVSCRLVPGLGRAVSCRLVPGLGRAVSFLYTHLLL